MKKKNINWEVPAALAEAFDATIKARYGGKAKWIGACGAIAMYLSASEEEQRRFDQLGTKATTEEGVSEFLSEVTGVDVEAEALQLRRPESSGSKRSRKAAKRIKK